MRRWWMSDTAKTFNSKKQCFIAQYSSKYEPLTEKKVR